MGDIHTFNTWAGLILNHIFRNEAADVSPKKKSDLRHRKKGNRHFNGSPFYLFFVCFLICSLTVLPEHHQFPRCGVLTVGIFYGFKAVIIAEIRRSLIQKTLTCFHGLSHQLICGKFKL